MDRKELHKKLFTSMVLEETALSISEVFDAYSRGESTDFNEDIDTFIKYRKEIIAKIANSNRDNTQSPNTLFATGLTTLSDGVSYMIEYALTLGSNKKLLVVCDEKEAYDIGDMLSFTFGGDPSEVGNTSIELAPSEACGEIDFDLVVLKKSDEKAMAALLPKIWASPDRRAVIVD